MRRTAGSLNSQFWMQCITARVRPCNLPIAGLHLDAINARNEIQPAINLLPAHKVLSLGVINGRNIWKTDLSAVLDWLEPIAQRLGDQLWIAPSCSLLHVPVDLTSEHKLGPEIKSWYQCCRNRQ